MSTDSTPATGPDPSLLRLRRAILERPSSNARRLKYADRLAELGAARSAEMIRDQIRHPEPGIPVQPPPAWPAIAVTFYRGFVEEAVIAREHLPRVGELLRDHPIVSVWIGQSYIGVAHVVVPEDCDDPAARPKWLAYVGCSAPHSSGRVVGWRAWDHRIDLMRELGAWAESVLPSEPPVEFARSPRRRSRR